MKKLFLIVLLFSTIICFAQQKKEAKNEVTMSPASIFFCKTDYNL